MTKKTIKSLYSPKRSFPLKIEMFHHLLGMRSISVVSKNVLLHDQCLCVNFNVCINMYKASFPLTFVIKRYKMISPQAGQF